MKTKMTLALMAMLGTLAFAASAQDNNPPNDGPPGGGPDQRGPGMNGQRPPLPAVVRALDANHDGVIDADEIANAPAALKTLDKNNDGKLSMQEAMGPRPQMRGGPNGQGGQGNRGPRNGPGGGGFNHPDGPPPGGNGDGNFPPDGPPPGDQ